MLIFRKISFWLALLGLFAAGNLVLKLRANFTEAVPPPPITPAPKAFPNSIGGAGIVEARRENTLVNVPSPGLVTDVSVKVWDHISKGQALFTLDSRDLQAALGPQRAQVRVTQATLLRLQDQLARLESVGDARAVSAEEIKLRRSDVAVAEAQLEAALSAVTQTEALIERLVIRSPIDGTVLQVNIRAGEYASPLAVTSPLVIGVTDELQVRVDVDEQLAPRIHAGLRASACVKGDSSSPIALEFVRIEPFIIPKKSLTGSSLERVDTRVLQVIFRFANSSARPVYVGQQMDVYMEDKQ